METIRINEDLVEIGGKVRVERGPARKTAKATEALLADTATATHYQVGQRDADGAMIEAGKPMTYIDWLGAKGWYVYALVEGGWVEDSFHDDETAAVVRAAAIATA